MQSNEDKRQLKKEAPAELLSAGNSSSPETASTGSNEADPANDGLHPPNPHADLDDDVDSEPMANAPFVNKVWLIVNNPANHQYIRWVPGGKSILIVDREGFEKQLLPYYFKHKRFTSFVRQLNMYGWHKVQDLSAGTMQSNEEHWQFANPNFIQSQPELLKDIVRNKGHKPTASASHNNAAQQTAGAPGSVEKDEAGPNGADSKSLQAILSELEQIKNRQQAIGEDLGRMRKDNELLWTEYYQTRERYDKQSQVLGRILRFLATIYGNQSKILDLKDPMNEIMMPGGPNPSQHYMNLLPAAQQHHFDSGIHDLREIEQLQHQIEEASTPGSSSTMDGANPTSASFASNRPSSISSQHSSTQRGPTQRGPAQRGPTQRGSTIDSTKSQTGPDLSGSNANTRSIPNANTPTNSLALANSRRLSNTPYWIEPEPNANNQLVRATPSRMNSTTARTGTPLSTANNPGYPVASSDRISPYDGAQLHEVTANNPNNSRMPADPVQFFPELGDLSAPGSMPPLTSQELEQITRDIASNGTSLQNIQDWLAKQNLDSDEHFNVDDFLDHDGTASPADVTTSRKNSTSVEEPDSKRVRVS